MLILKTAFRFWMVAHWDPVLIVCNVMYYPDSAAHSLSQPFSMDVLGDFLVMLALVGQRHLLILQSLWYEKEATSPSSAPEPTATPSTVPTSHSPQLSSSNPSLSMPSPPTSAPSSPVLAASTSASPHPARFPRSGESVLYRLGKEWREGEAESEEVSEESETEWYWGFKRHFDRIVLLRPERSKDYYARILGLELLFFVGI